MSLGLHAYPGKPICCSSIWSSSLLFIFIIYASILISILSLSYIYYPRPYSSADSTSPRYHIYASRSQSYSIVIPDEIEGLHVVDVDTRYLWGTFGRYGIKSVMFSDYIADLPEDGCFSYNGCSRLLESVTLPAYITKVRQRTFSTCEKLKYVDIPDAVTEISYLAFDGCKSLKTITLPPSVKSIGGYAFYDCEALEEVIVADGAKIEFSSGSSTFLRLQPPHDEE